MNEHGHDQTARVVCDLARIVDELAGITVGGLKGILVRRSEMTPERRDVLERMDRLVLEAGLARVLAEALLEEIAEEGVRT